MQAVMAAIAGYLGYYTSQTQPNGKIQAKQLREATERNVQGEPSRGASYDFNMYAHRLVEELKGTIRTAVGGMDLSLHWSVESDILAAECIRTFPTVASPATLLLKREEKGPSNAAACKEDR